MGHAPRGGAVDTIGRRIGDSLRVWDLHPGPDRRQLDYTFINDTDLRDASVGTEELGVAPSMSA